MGSVFCRVGSHPKSGWVNFITYLSPHNYCIFIQACLEYTYFAVLTCLSTSLPPPSPSLTAYSNLQGMINYASNQEWNITSIRLTDDLNDHFQNITDLDTSNIFIFFSSEKKLQVTLEQVSREEEEEVVALICNERSQCCYRNSQTCARCGVCLGCSP